MNQPLRYFLFSYSFILMIQVRGPGGGGAHVCKDFGRHVEFEIGGKKMSPELEMTHTYAPENTPFRNCWHQVLDQVLEDSVLRL